MFQAPKRTIPQGAFEATGNPLDFAIEGDGFFEVAGLNQERQFTRSGNFNVNAQGQLVLGSAHNGYIVQPPITIPQNAIDIVVSADGNVQIRTQDADELTTVGQLQIATFINPDGLLKLGGQPLQGHGSIRATHCRSSRPTGCGRYPPGIPRSVQRRTSH